MAEAVWVLRGICKDSWLLWINMASYVGSGRKPKLSRAAINCLCRKTLTGNCRKQLTIGGGEISQGEEVIWIGSITGP